MKNKKSGMAALFIAAFAWGSGYYFMKVGLSSFTPLYLLALRFSMAFFLMLLCWIPKPAKIKKSTVKYGVIMGGVMFLEFALFALGLERTTASKSSFIVGSYVAILPMVYWLIRKKSPGKYAWAGSFLCTLGLCFILLGKFDSINWGDILTIGSSICYAVHIVMMGMWVKEENPVTINLFQFLVTAILSWIGAFVLEPPMEMVKLDNYISVFQVALISTVIPYFFNVYGQKYVKTATSAIILSLESVVGCFLSVLLLGERLEMKFILGAALIFVACIVSEWKETPDKGHEKQEKAEKG